MKQKTILVALIAALIVDQSLGDAAQKPEQLRPKRTLSWPQLPSFFGASAPAPAAAAATVVEDVPSVEIKAQGPKIVGQYPDGTIINRIINEGQLVNNQLHYPIWRIHKYNGLHLQPIPVSLVRDANGVPVASGGVDNAVQSLQSVETDSPTQVTSTPVESWLSPELIEMARRFGVTDFKNLPSLQQAMDVLGTTTREDTNAAIKEYAATEEGRNLIRQFVLNGGLGTQDDNEVAASEVQEAVQAPDGAEAIAIGEPVGAASTQQNVVQPFPSNIISQLASFSARPAQSEQQQQQEAEPEEVETTTRASLFGQIARWTSFLNPFTNRQEIPIPPSSPDVEVRVSYPKNLNDEHIANQNTVPLPPLPELVPLPSVPGAEQDPPQLPNVHIPARYIAPQIPYTNGFSGQGGHYVRVKLPLAGFNPTPEYNIDPKYLHYGRTLLQQQKVSQVPYILTNVQERTPLKVPVSAPVQLVSAPISTQLTQNPSLSGESVESLQLPTLQASSFSQSEATSGSVSQESVQQVAQPAPVLVNPTPKIHLTQSSSGFAQSSVGQQQLPTIGAQFQQSGSIASAVPVASSVQQNQRIRLIQAPLVNAKFDGPIVVSEPATYVSQNLHLPTRTVLQPFRPVVQQINSPRQALHVGELPLVPTAGYEVIQNGPRVVSSYGAPYEYFYFPSNSGANAHVNKDYELRPAATENKDVIENANVDGKSTTVENIDADPVLNEIENEENEETVETARSDSNDQATADADHNDENDQDQSSVSVVEDKTKTETDSQDITEDKENVERADVTVTEETESAAAETLPEPVESTEEVVATAISTEPTPEKPTTKKSVYNNLRPKMKIIKTQSEEKKISKHIQRISPPESRINRIYRADQKAMEMMPFTVNYVARKTAQTEDVEK